MSTMLLPARSSLVGLMGRIVVARSVWPAMGAVIGLIVILGALGCAATPPSPGKAATPTTLASGTAPVRGGVYRKAFSDKVLTLDPREIGDSFSHEVARQMLDGLCEFDDHARVIPALARSWDVSADKREYTFHLASGVFFQATTGPDNEPTANGGRALVADDVRYSFLRLLDPKVASSRAKFFWVIAGAEAYFKGTATDVVGLRVIDAHTIAITLEKPFAPFLSLLATPNAFIVPREDAEKLGASFSRRPVGTGAFSWAGNRGDGLILRANTKYYKGCPHLEGIEFLVTKSEEEAFVLFKKNEVYHVGVPAAEYLNVKNDPKLGPLMLDQSRWGCYYLGFNTASAPFDNVKVRQAINFAIDRDAIIDLVLNGRAKKAKGVLPPGIDAFNPELQGYEYNVQRARQLLAEAGYPEGKGFPPITLQFNRDPVHSRTSEFIIANLRDIGVTCTYKEVEFDAHMRAVDAGEIPFFRMGWVVDYPDPDNLLYVLFHSSNIGERGNAARYTNAKVDALLDQARAETIHERRIQLYRAAEQLIVDDAPWVFVYHYTTQLLVQPYVHGLVLTPMGSSQITYRDLWLDPQPAAVR